MEKALQQLARKELEQFTNTVHGRICRGRPYTAEAPTKTGFGELVDSNGDIFKSFANRLGEGECLS